MVSFFYGMNFLGLVVVYILDCDGLVCLYRGTIDLDTCQCQCQSYTSGKQCQNLNCLSLPDECVYVNSMMKWKNIMIQSNC